LIAAGELFEHLHAVVDGVGVRLGR
jgi:hypothetical protein